MGCATSHTPRLMTGRYERIEVITGVERRRRWSVEEKLRIVTESLTAGVPVSVVARRHRVRSNLLFRWRKLARQGVGPLPDGVLSFVPVRVVADGAVARAVPATASLQSDRPPDGGKAVVSTVEIELPNGCRLRVVADIDSALLHRLVTVVKAAG
jgi:transposase